MRAFDETAHAHLIVLQLFVAYIPNRIGCLTVQYSLEVKKPLQLQMTPVKQRISNSFFQSLGIFLKFVPIRGLPCNIIFLYAIRTHQTPLVVIRTEPHLCDIFKSVIQRDFFWIDMTVVIENRKRGCKLDVYKRQVFEGTQTHFQNHLPE